MQNQGVAGVSGSLPQAGRSRGQSGRAESRPHCLAKLPAEIFVMAWPPCCSGLISPAAVNCRDRGFTLIFV
ncbi:MAG: hypothetical protein AB1461_10220 [Thermodesulfobacteriota bacterium]